MPVRLASEGLDRRHDARDAIVPAQRGPPASRERLSCAARQDPQQGAVTEKEATKRPRHGEDRVAMRLRREDLLPQLLRQQLRPLLLT